MTLDDFMVSASPQMLDFANATKARIAEGDADFTAEREMIDWWAEVFAFQLWTLVNNLLAAGDTVTAEALLTRYLKIPQSDEPVEPEPTV